VSEKYKWDLFIHSVKTAPVAASPLVSSSNSRMRCFQLVDCAILIRGCYFPSGSDGHLAPSYASSRLGPRTATSNCGRRHGGYTGWRGSENSRRGLVGEIISPYGYTVGRVRVRVMGRVRVTIGLGVGFELGL